MSEETDHFKSIFIHCTNENNNMIILLQNAIFWAERGFHVWIITLNQIKKLPLGWNQIPERETLKNMTFLCLPNRNELFEKLQNIHHWTPTPTIILVSQLDQYFEVVKNYLDISIGALCCATLLESIQICSRKLKRTTYLAATFSSQQNQKLLQTLINLYFYDNVFEVNEQNCLDVIEKLKSIYKHDEDTTLNSTLV